MKKYKIKCENDNNRTFFFPRTCDIREYNEMRKARGRKKEGSVWLTTSPTRKVYIREEKKEEEIHHPLSHTHT